MADDKGFTVNDRRIDLDDGEQLKQPTAEEMDAAERAIDASPCSKAAMLPKVDFSTFVLSMYSSAMVALGEVPEPETGKTSVNRALAKHSIDIMAMLKETVDKGMTNDERRLMEALLYELRMKFVMQCR